MRTVTKTLGVGLLAVAAAIGALTVPAAAATAATPGNGFSYGTDSWPMSGTGSAPFNEPVIGGSYGGYIGMAGNWARWGGCKTGNMLAWAPANANQANENYVKYHVGVGVGVYWYMGGPGVDPHWNGTTAEASNWGARQAAQTLASIKGRYIPYPVIWADIEQPGIAPAPDNGWNSVYTSMCSGHVKQVGVSAAVDRAEFNGYAAYLTAHSKFKVGVYSAAPIWSSIFGTGKYASIPNTYEWTYLPATKSLSAAPSGWCLRGTSTCAQFFGGQSSSSKYALMWQWSGGGGFTNGHGDFDQIDVARMK
ncbi:MAG: hypothetical protein ACRDOI_04885 [Trebonia sp.]